MISTMTPAERRVYHRIRQDILTRGRAPSYDELADVAGTKGNAHRIVSQLVAAGHLHRVPGRNRGISLAPGADTYTIHLAPEIDGPLLALAVACDEVPEVIIARALADYLRRAA
ncbi:hypothetical protein [uncultured Methylobacterium sp.]|uniref:LexA family protein n=1 Tax=uncultured Methylobacterium sp. TaxID=157278 RepID=UPI00258B90F4|nr:hypothetical protein [uncultured Methylobacterium sp.]